MSTPTELFIAAELPKRPYTNTFPFAAGKTLITTGVGLEVVAGDAPGEYLDNTFRIKDNDDTTKKIAFQASGIATGETRTITMPDADVNLSKTPTGVAADYISGGLSMPLVDGTYVNLNTFGGTHLDGPNSPATVLSPNGHYLFSTDTGFYYAGTRLLTLPTAPADKTYVRLSNVSGISSFATGAGAEVTPGGSDKINGSTSTLDITTYLVNYRGAVITFTYTASSANWNMSVLGDLIRPSSVAIYDADKTNSTTLTPVADLTDNRVITLPDADVNLGKVSQAASTSTDGYLTSTDWNTFNGKQATLVSGTNIKTVNGSSLLGTGNLTITTPTTFSDSAFRIQDNDDANKLLAFELSGIVVSPAATPTVKTITMPNANVNLGTMSSVATTDYNTLSGTRNRILGGSHNTVSGTGNVVINGTSVVTSSALGQTIQSSSGSMAGIDWPTRFIGNGTVRGTDSNNAELATVITQLKALNIYDAGSAVLTTDNAAASASNTPKAAVANPHDDASTGVATHELDLQVATRFSTGLFIYLGVTHAKYLISVTGTTATPTLVSSCADGTVATFTVTPSVVSGRLYLTVANTTGSDRPMRCRGVLKSLYSYV